MEENKEADVDELTELFEKLRTASTIRNVICHGSWKMPNELGQSVPFFANKQKEIFGDRIDVEYFQNLQIHTAELACAVINSISRMGWQFPGLESSVN